MILINIFFSILITDVSIFSISAQLAHLTPKINLLSLCFGTLQIHLLFWTKYLIIVFVHSAKSCFVFLLNISVLQLLSSWDFNMQFNRKIVFALWLLLANQLFIHAQNLPDGIRLKLNKLPDTSQITFLLDQAKYNIRLNPELSKDIALYALQINNKIKNNY